MNQLAPRNRYPLSPLGRLISRRCDELGLNRGEFAAAAEVSPSHLSKLMHGLHKPHTETLERIAATLRMSLAELLDEIDEVSVMGG